MGGTILDVSAQTSTVVHTGDALIFQLLTSSYGVNAAQWNLPRYPTDINFAFVSAPLIDAPGFAATLESADGKMSVVVGDLTFGSGSLDSSEYTGEVSVLQGRLSLSQLESETLFGTPSIVIALRNKGPDVTVGLAGYLLRQDLFTSLSAGPLSVGAAAYSVGLESPDRPRNSKSLWGAAPLVADSAVPEPRTGGLLLGGGVLLSGISALLARVSRRRCQAGYRAKNQPFASVNPV